MKKTLRWKDYKIVVFLKEDGGNLVPLKFDVYLGKMKINHRIRWSLVREIERGLYEHFNTRLSDITRKVPLS